MRNKDPKRILKAKSDLSEDEIGGLSIKEAWELVYSLSVSEKDTRLEICFTGFSKSESEYLKEIAVKENLKVVGSVTRKLHVLVIGDAPGPAKLSQAKKQSSTIMDKDEYLNKYGCS